MAKDNGPKCKMLISLHPDLRKKFKSWCAEHGTSMNTGVCALIATVCSKEKYKLQSRVLKYKQ